MRIESRRNNILAIYEDVSSQKKKKSVQINEKSDNDFQPI